MPAMIHVGTSRWSFTTRGTDAREIRVVREDEALFSLHSFFLSLALLLALSLSPVTRAREGTRRSTLRLLKLQAARFRRTAANGRVIFGPKARFALVIFGRRTLRLLPAPSAESCANGKSMAIYRGLEILEMEFSVIFVCQ